MTRALTALTLFAVLTACVADVSTSETEQTICNDTQPNCPGGHPITSAELRGDTRTRYGQPTGRVSCTAIHSLPGIHNTICTVSLGGLTLFQCTFNYYVDTDGDATIQSTACH